MANKRITVNPASTRRLWWWVVTVVFLGLAGYLIYTNFTPTSVAPTSGTGSQSTVRDLPIYDDLGESVLDSEEFKSLRTYGTLPVTGGPKGRSNPFLPPF